MAAKTPLIPAHQKNAHLVDTLKDLIAQAFKKEFDLYLNSKTSSFAGLRGLF